ncbi:MAG: endospore germination permease [Paenibacillaceae bacterium]|nr:endospore germination permease [Paenibacillaceae bacterium]
MKQQGNSISFLQMAMVFMMCIGLMNHVIVIPLLLSAAERDAWLAVIAAAAVYVVWIPVVGYILRGMNGERFVPWLAGVYGPFAARLIGATAAFYLFFFGGITLKDTTLWTISSYLPQTPALVIASAGMLLIGCAAVAGLRPIAITAGILLPFVILFGFFVMSANIEHKRYELLLPILENGYRPVTHGMLYVGGGFLELLTIVFLQQHLSTKAKTWQLIVLGMIIAGLTIGPTMGSIAEFGPFEAAKQRYPAYEQWRMVKIGKYIEHLDFLSIYQWLTGAFIRISVAVFAIADLLAFRSPRRKIMLIVAICALMIAYTLYPYDDVFFVRFMYRVYFPATSCYLIALSLALAVAAWIATRRRRKGEETS